MAGLILIVDDLSLNRTVLRGKLASACYRTITANGGKAALGMVRDQQPDLIMLDFHMPDLDGLAVCKAIRADPVARDTPIILFSANADHAHRLAALSAGADDFMAKPLDETFLLGRIRSLLRNVSRQNKWRGHPNVTLQTGFAEAQLPFEKSPELGLICDRAETSHGWMATISAIWPEAQVQEIPLPTALGLEDPLQAPDLFVITPDALTGAGLHIVAELRARAATQHAEICLILPHQACADCAMALDLGAADILRLPLDRAETRMRLERIIAQKKRADAQRQTVRNQLGLAAIDPLTGLHNRSHGFALIQQALTQEHGKLALLLIDLDRFKEINDQHGHNAGDQVLHQVANRMRQAMRQTDILCRYGGDEFLLALPQTDMAAALRIAETLCALIAQASYPVEGQTPALSVSASVGLSLYETADTACHPDALPQLVEASDRALRLAKRSGRNRVVAWQRAMA